MATEYLNYPKLKISMNGGDLVDVYDVQMAFEDGETSVSTMRQNPSGSTGGKRNCKVTFKSAQSEAGPERPYWADYAKRKVNTIRIKAPGVTHVVTGRLTSPSVSGNVDSFADMSWTLMGKHTTV